MKKLLAAVLCIAVALSMTFTAFGAEQCKAAKDDTDCTFSLSGLGDALSGLLSDLSEAIPEVLASVEEAIPEIVSSVKDAISEGTNGAKDAIDSIAGQIGISSDSGKDTISGIAPENGPKDSKETDGSAGSLQGLIDHLSNTLGNGMNYDDYDDVFDDGPYDDGPYDDLYDDGPYDDDLYDRGAIVGGWTVNTEYTNQLSKEEEEIFKKAETTLAGGAYTPVAVIGTQVVAGTNYAYLCLGAPDNHDRIASWYIVTLYQDLQGNVTTMSIDDIDLSDIETISNIYNPAFVGSWAAEVPETTDPLLPEDAQAAFEAATEGYVGVGYTPIALLGTQVVAGCNYKILCYGTLVTKDPVTSWYVLDIYQDPQGNCSITDAQLFDLTDYISYGAYDIDDNYDRDFDDNYDRDFDDKYDLDD